MASASRPTVACGLLLALLLLFGEQVSAGKDSVARTHTGKGDFPRSLVAKEHQFNSLRLQPGPRPKTAELARQLRERRANYRQGKFDARPGAALTGGVSFCEEEAVGPRVRKDYLNRVEAFNQFVKDTLDVALVPGHNFVEALLEYIDSQFFEGFPVEDGRKWVAAIKHHYPCFQRGGSFSLARAERALRGWGRHSVSRTRAPLPRPILSAIIGFMLHQSWTWTAVALALGFVTYLRPGELFGLQKRHLIPPMPEAGLPHWAVHFRLTEDETPTKTGTFDESIVIDGEWSTWLNTVLQFLYSNLDDYDSLWIKLSHEDMYNMLKMASMRLGLQVLDLEWYCVRHGGASHDAVMGHRPLDSIQKRLRHLSITTVRRYEKSGRLGAELRKAPKEVLRFGLDMEKVMDRVFTDRSALPALPDLAPPKKC